MIISDRPTNKRVGDSWKESANMEFEMDLSSISDDDLIHEIFRRQQKHNVVVLRNPKHVGGVKPTAGNYALAYYGPTAPMTSTENPD